MTVHEEDLFLGLDLSTQQLKAVALNSDLETKFQEQVKFDSELPQYKTANGVYVNSATDEITAPVEMWIDALDLLLTKLKKSNFPFSRVRSISGACQQHGSVFWSYDAPDLLRTLNESSTSDSQNSVSLVDILCPNAFSYDRSPNWQDHSTKVECEAFESAVGGAENLAKITGSKSHHRFTGPQILKLRTHHPEIYEKTERISLVSSFLASILLGFIAPIDIADACGMNLWDMPKDEYNLKLCSLTAGGPDKIEALIAKLRIPERDGGAKLGLISNYFVRKYGFSNTCSIITFTGDNPGTILATMLRPMDAMVSLGTSTTLLISTPTYHPSSTYHLFDHPTSRGLFMGMLCYCNGSLAREQIRDKINASHNATDNKSWATFNQVALSTPPLGRILRGGISTSKLGFYFPLSEIIPDVPAGTERFIVNDSTGEFKKAVIGDEWKLPDDDARCIVESQALSMRLRVHPMLKETGGRPRRLYLVGGGSQNDAIVSIMSEVLNPLEGTFRPDVSNACAVGAANKAAWGCLRKVDPKSVESFEDFLSKRLSDDRFERLDDKVVHNRQVHDVYKDILGTFSRAEDSFVSETKVKEYH